jgi:hypothetical protein
VTLATDNGEAHVERTGQAFVRCNGLFDSSRLDESRIFPDVLVTAHQKKSVAWRQRQIWKDSRAALMKVMNMNGEHPPERSEEG